MKPNAATIVLAVVFIANVFSARADEKLSSLQAALSSATISGYVSTELFLPTVDPTFAAFQPQQQISGRQAWHAQFPQRRSRNDGAALSPFPLINPSEVEITAPPLNLIDVGVQNPSLNLQPFQPIIGDANSIPGVTCGGDSSGAEIISAGGGYARPQSPSIPPLPGFQFQLNQAGIQPVPAPEPSTVALGGVAVGLFALLRLNRRKQI